MDKTPTQWMVEPLRRYAEFNGRARKAEYWWFVLFACTTLLGLMALDVILDLRNFSFRTIGLLGLFIPHLAAGFRRLHDINRTGWWLGAPVILFVPLMIGLVLLLATMKNGGVVFIIGLFGVWGIGLAYFIALFILLCQKGTRGPNRFGPDPLAIDDR